MSTLIIAAGGGGDALGAQLARKFLKQGDGPLFIATYAWERLRIDPVPGPRGLSGFSGLGLIDDTYIEILAQSDTIPPGRSMLPRLVASTNERLFLLDTTQGAFGLSDQIQRLIRLLPIDTVVVLDVGGDILGRGDEPDLLSPLADALALTGTFSLDVPVTALVVGPGADGELGEDTLRNLLDILGADELGSVEPEDAAGILPILEWHPSEATALVAAAALGVHGSAEIRRRSNVVSLTSATATVWQVPIDALRARSLILDPLSRTRSLDEADDVVRPLSGSELDYERAKALTFVPSLGTIPEAVELRSRVGEYARDALSRDIDFITLRRMAEAIDAPSMKLADLTEALTMGRHSYLHGPLLDTHALGSF